jgi:hypothetical protein
MAEIWLRKYNANNIAMVFKIKVFDNIAWKFTSPISPMPLPEESGQENVLVKMEGNTHTVQLTWLVREDTVNSGVTNSAVGNANAGATKTMFDQLKWFSAADGFIGRSMVDKFDILVFDNFNKGGGGTLTTYDMTAGSVAAGSYVEFQDPAPPTDPANPETGDWLGLAHSMEGYIRDLQFRTASNEPATLRATVEFIEGNAIGSYQGAKPAEPTNLRLLAPTESQTSTAKKILVKWSAPTHTGNSSLTNYYIMYKLTASNDEFLPHPVATNNAGSGGYHLGSLSPSTQYSIKVRAVNSEGSGRSSSTRHFTTEAA